MDETTANDEVRAELLTRLAERAMSDPAFRAEAAADLAGALLAHGYHLNERELALVLRFRAALEEAGIDLSLGQPLDPERLAVLMAR